MSARTQARSTRSKSKRTRTATKGGSRVRTETSAVTGFGLKTRSGTCKTFVPGQTRSQRPGNTNTWAPASRTPIPDRTPAGPVYVNVAPAKQKKEKECGGWGTGCCILLWTVVAIVIALICLLLLACSSGSTDTKEGESGTNTLSEGATITGHKQKPAPLKKKFMSEPSSHDDQSLIVHDPDVDVKDSAPWSPSPKPARSQATPARPQAKPARTSPKPAQSSAKPSQTSTKPAQTPAKSSINIKIKPEAKPTSWKHAGTGVPSKSPSRPSEGTPKRSNKPPPGYVGPFYGPGSAKMRKYGIRQKDKMAHYNSVYGPNAPPLVKQRTTSILFNPK